MHRTAASSRMIAAATPSPAAATLTVEAPAPSRPSPKANSKVSSVRPGLVKATWHPEGYPSRVLGGCMRARIGVCMESQAA
jgi:hypothetical protein